MGIFLKENKALAMFLFASLLLLFVIVAILTTSFLKLNELKRVEQTLVAEIEQQAGKVGNAKENSNRSLRATSFEQSGYPAHLLKEDTQLVSDFFRRAFTWSSEDAYEVVRSSYIELLGEHNSFVEMYLAEDYMGKVPEMVNTSEEMILDPVVNETLPATNSLVTEAVYSPKSEVEDVEIIPIRAQGDKIYYIGFITYYVGDEVLFENKAGLTPETAIVEFSITNTENGREINDVKAWIAAE